MPETRFIWITSSTSMKLYLKLLIACVCIMLFVLFKFVPTTNLPVFQRDNSKQRVPITLLDCPILNLNSTVSYTYAITPEEAQFPLAFSIIVHTDPDRVLRLFRAIYRPHNYYCIHIDRKSSSEFSEAIGRVQHCTGMAHNVFLVPPSDRVDVQWGRMSVLDADLACARLLLNRAPPVWKYWINLTGQEFPLRTNWELVTALRLLNGANLVAATYRRRNRNRFPLKTALPFNFTWYKGSVHVAVRREFVNYALNNPRGKLVYEVLVEHERATGRAVVPDETFFATLNHNPNTFPIPGAFTGEHEENVSIPLARAKVWKDSKRPCGSKVWRHTICMFGLADLPFLLTQPHFFANKFLPRVEPLAYDLLELWHAAKTYNETIHGKLADSFNRTYYHESPYAKQHL